jgi:hypothetical protein
MKNLFRIILLGVLVALSAWMFNAIETEAKGLAVDPIIQPYLDEWKVTMASNEIDISRLNNIKSISIEKNVGSFGISNERLRTIVIDESAVAAGPATLRNTIYHELGHYLFGFEHTSDKCIMHKDNLGEDIYKSTWSTYKEQYVTKIILQQHFD